MKEPYLLVVTGRPGAGKTTFAKELSKGVDMARKGIELSVSPYEEPRLDVPTFYIDTSGKYSPFIKELRRKILGELE